MITAASAGGQINGAATLSWRTLGGTGQEVIFYDDYISQSSVATYEITVFVAGESCEFTGERGVNAGLFFDQLTFKVRATQAGFNNSAPLEVSVTRSSFA